MKNRIAQGMGFVSILAVSSSAFAQQWGEIEKLTDFIGRDQPLTNARTIDQIGLSSSVLKTIPWSSTYWADMLGSIAYPYRDEGINAWAWFANWGIGKRVLQNRGDMHTNMDTLSDGQIDHMSPAEKYDLLIGDRSFTMTSTVVEMLDQRHDMGLMANWSGICHGWSPAALTLPRPKHVVNMTAPNGRTIPFYPSDVKALASFLWGKSGAQSMAKVDGWQCQSGARTNKYGRLVDPRCFDTNPAFLHMTAVNQIGVKQSGFIMDREFKTEVQNQPVYAYSLKYYKVSDRNPQPGMAFNDARIPYNGSFWDPYKPYRSPNIKGIVGVEMTLTWAKEHTVISPDQSAEDDESHDQHDTYTTRYDLELDDNDNIIGGEWQEFGQADAQTVFEQFQYKHPDVIWLIPADVKAWSTADFSYNIQNTPWDGSGAIPPNWRQAAIEAAHATVGDFDKGKPVDMKNPSPLARVVDILIDLSRK